MKQQSCYKLAMLTALNVPHMKPGPWVTYYLSGHIQRNISSLSKNNWKTMLKIFCSLLGKHQRGIIFTTHCNSWIIFLIFLFSSSLPHMALASLKLSAPPFRTLSKPPRSAAASPLPPLHSEFLWSSPEDVFFYPITQIVAKTNREKASRLLCPGTH